MRATPHINYSCAGRAFVSPTHLDGSPHAGPMNPPLASLPGPSRPQRSRAFPPQLTMPTPFREASSTPPLQLVSELETMRSHYPPDRRNPMDLDFICHNSMKYRCCFCDERILVHESELVLDKFFEKHRCPKRREHSAEASSPISPTDDPASSTQGIDSCLNYASPNPTSLSSGRRGWNIKDPDQQPQVHLSWYVDWLVNA